MKRSIELREFVAGYKRFFRRSKLAAFSLLLMLCCVFVDVTAAEKVLTKEQTEARVIAIKDRVTEIQSMDKAQLTVAERKDLRRELKDMNKELRQMHPTYLYISGGGLLLIIILLILFL